MPHPAFGFTWGRGPDGVSDPGVQLPGKREPSRVACDPEPQARCLKAASPVRGGKGVSQGCRFQNLFGSLFGTWHRREDSRDPEVSSSPYATQTLLGRRKAVNVKIMHP